MSSRPHAQYSLGTVSIYPGEGEMETRRGQKSREKASASFAHGRRRRGCARGGGLGRRRTTHTRDQVHSPEAETPGERTAAEK